MSLAHLHLLLNHVPTVGAGLAFVILMLGYIRRNDHLKHIGLELLFVIALLTFPLYFSGAGAHRELRALGETAGVVNATIRAHQDAAIWGSLVTALAGFVGWIALWQTRRHGRAARGVVPAAMVLLLLALVIMGRAANLGGQIRHPEIAPEAATASATPQYLQSAVATYMTNESPWAWPAGEALHFIGMSLSIGVLLAVNLRILGVMPQVSFAQVHRLLPWGMLGFGVNFLTGMLFFVASPGQYVQNVPFYWKVVFLMIAGANFLYLTVSSTLWANEGRDARLADKAMAVASIAAWLAVLYAGRMLPFLGNAF